MEKFMAGYERLCKITYQIIEILCRILLIVMVFSVTVAVVGRFGFKYTPRWTEELGIICLVCICFLSAQIAVYNGGHIRMTLIEYILKPNIVNKIYRCGYVVLVLMNILWIIFGCSITMKSGMNKLPATGWPVMVEYIPVIISGVAGVILSFGKLLKGGEKL